MRAEFVQCIGRPPRIEPSVEAGDVFGEPSQGDGPLLREFKGRTGRFSKGVALVIGNPPYVESKRLTIAAKSRLRALYPNAGVGALESFVYFIQPAGRALGTDGRRAFGPPNRLLLAAGS